VTDVPDVPVLAEATPAPTVRVAQPALPVALTTAMVLVDYALAGKATPTPGAQAAAEAMPAELADTSHPMRAVFAHGTYLRDFLVSELPPDHAGQRDYPPLRTWLARLSDERIQAMVAAGSLAVLGYGKPRAEWPTVPDVVEVVRVWGVADPEEWAAELADPAFVREQMLAFLDAVWELWLSRTWREELPALQSAAAVPAPSGVGGVQAVTQVTGLRPDPQYAAAIERAGSLVLMPCPGLGRSLSMLMTETETWVLYSPQGVSASAAPDGRSGIAVGRLALLAPTMQALGDRTRLAIVLYLVDHGPVSMQALSDAVRVHQSTVSRQVATLRKAGLVEVDEQRRIVARPDAIRRTCHTLLEAIE
jgi:DNA-binding transcriptional ArsR family regulator